MSFRPRPVPRFRVVRHHDGMFGVEGKLPGSKPSLLATFETAKEAEKWIVDYQRARESNGEPSDDAL